MCVFVYSNSILKRHVFKVYNSCICFKILGAADGHEARIEETPVAMSWSLSKLSNEYKITHWTITFISHWKFSRHCFMKDNNLETSILCITGTVFLAISLPSEGKSRGVGNVGNFWLCQVHLFVSPFCLSLWLFLSCHPHHIPLPWEETCNRNF